ncbi:flavoprotein [Arachnia propionica]|uniref:flavoprotein n=1 Tax=Arachnia propionica TaxID=1750 RepID=UPI0028D25DD4|nr:flavoprotein [Arachnia propionica]
MNEKQLRELITRIVRELLAEQPRQETPATGKPNALVLFSGALLGFDAALESLKRAAAHVNLDWRQTTSASRVLDQERIAALGMTPAEESLVQAHDLLVIPTLTANLAAKVAHGIGDCLASNVVAEFIMSNKPVVVATNGVCPDSADKRGWFPQMPSGYAAMLRENLAALKSFGVHLATAETLDRVVGEVAGAGNAVHCTARVVTESVIRSLAPGSRLSVHRRAIITDLARDAAASSGVTITRRS